MAGVFISYSQTDRECAFELVGQLEGQGIQCWIAPRDIAPSADWAAEIMDAISAARIMILVFSAGSNHSPQVRREVERAVHKQLSILPFRIEDVLPSKSLEFFLSTQHWMDAFPPPREPHYARLCGYLKTQLSAAAVPAAPTPAPAPAGARRQDFDAAHLQHIERQLAGFIGPLARHLVKSAASCANGADDLVERLAGELENDSERREFRQQCRIGRTPS
jgi:TIR domain